MQFAEPLTSKRASLQLPPVSTTPPVAERAPLLETMTLPELLAAEDERVYVEKEYEGLTYIENTQANRVQLMYDGKPDQETRTKLKRAGFRWSPSEGAWQRHLNSGGIWAAEQFCTNQV